jgi:hypothetical protein
VTGPEAVPVDHWASVWQAIDRAFGTRRPEKFTDHPYCEECANADEYFRGFTPETIAEVTEPPETLPLSFLTEEAFLYLAPGILRWLPRAGHLYCLGDVLFHVERWLYVMNARQRAALRDLLYALYEHMEAEIRATPFDYPTIWRILNDLDQDATA